MVSISRIKTPNTKRRSYSQSNLPLRPVGHDPKDVRFGVRGSGLGLQGARIRVQVSGFRFWVSGCRGVVFRV